MQLDSLPQSPQPSHTASLMKTRVCGSGKVPRFLRRRFSAAQVWSKTRADTPGTVRSSRWITSSSSRWRIGMPWGMSATCQARSVPSVTSTMVCTPSPCSWRSSFGTVRSPSTGWPPVMATASLKRIL
jgi:hypothetical protein